MEEKETLMYLRCELDRRMIFSKNLVFPQKE